MWIATAKGYARRAAAMNGQRVLSRPEHLLERDRELAEIDACIAAATAEQGTFLVLEGRSGMGKSALLGAVRGRAAAAGLATCAAAGSELEGEFAFGVVRQLFEPAIGALTDQERPQIFEGAAALAEPVLDIGGEDEGRSQFAALHGLYWLAANLSARTPLLLAVDDAHWADTASLRWLAYLLNRLEGLPLLVAMATRPPQSGTHDEVLATILAQPRTRIVPVGPLGEVSVAALIRGALGAEPDPVFTAACLRATAANPLGVSELLRDLQAGGVAPTSAAAADLEARAPDAIARRVRRDLSLLGCDAERMAKALAVIGDGTELRLIARLADLDADRAAEAADDLLAADLIASDRPPRFAHPLLRAAVYDHLPEGARQELHRQAAEILASEGAEPEAVAAHVLRSEAVPSAQTIECLRAAAPSALRRGAPEAAVSYLKRALVEDIDTSLRRAILVELGRAELAAGDVAAVVDLREALTGTTEPRIRAGLLVDLALAAVLDNDDSACRRLLQEAFEELRDFDPNAATGLECVAIGMSSADPLVGWSVDKHYPRLRELARVGGEDAKLARVVLAMLLSWRDGNREEALASVGSGFDWKVVLGGGYLHSFGAMWAMHTLLAIDEPRRAAGLCRDIIREGTAEGNPPLMLSAMVFRVYAESCMGLLAEAEADATAALELSRQMVPYWVPPTLTWLADIHFERGRQQTAYEVIEGISLSPAVAGGMMEATVREVRGRLRCARGWRELGVDDLRESGRLCEILRLRNPIIWPWRASLAAALAQDCPDEAHQLAQEDLKNARRSGLPRAIGVALRTLAGLDRDNSIDLLREAIMALEGSPAPLDLARALADLGGALRRQGHRVEAREPLREALEIAARCGAVPLMERVQAEALAAGARPRRPRLRGVDALTPSELRVARLAAEGRSNREIAEALFITAKTVADHLGGSYSKLDISSREELTLALGLSNP
jgi:DNA-binding CsgD family transcriptional regulator